MERNMDVSRKQFLEWWRHPEQEELRKSCAEGEGGENLVCFTRSYRAGYRLARIEWRLLERWRRRRLCDGL